MASSSPSTDVVRAEDVAPSAFAAADESLAAELALLGVKRPDDLEVDEGNVSAWDSHPVDGSKMQRKAREKYLAKRARDGVQLLLRRVFTLPYERTPDGPMAILPPAKLRLPRRLPVPEPKADTKWEAFAREKGIKKQKRSRMVFDEESGEWKPRWGYGRAKDDTKDWLIPVKEGEDPHKDPYEERKLKKKERVLKNKLQQLRNAERDEAAKSSRHSSKQQQHQSQQAGARKSKRVPTAAEEIAAAAASFAPSGIPKTLKASEGDVSGVTGQGRSKRSRPTGETRADKGNKVRAAQIATASMGRFDRRLPGEPEPPKDPIRHKKRTATPADGSEHSRDLAVLSAVMHAPASSSSSSSSSSSRTAGAAGSRVFKKDRVKRK